MAQKFQSVELNVALVGFSQFVQERGDKFYVFGPGFSGYQNVVNEILDAWIVQFSHHPGEVVEPKMGPSRIHSWHSTTNFDLVVHAAKVKLT